MQLDTLSELNKELSQQRDDELKSAYQSIFNSLGVEPGLLSKTPIGRNLNDKYRDDSIDTVQYITKYKAHMNDKNMDKPETITIGKYTPIDNSDIFPESMIIGSATDITASNKSIPIIDDSMWQIMRKFQLSNNLSTEKVIQEITKYIEKYAPNYRITTI